ncbi:MAG TPA: 2-oxo acid dehydrogenase subunit E2 [Candidatus Krumholzibacteria bacterium]|nr:2-oxo acid dehydrogenase subunit E2 [Candidatus Krumholzibacteria bacterium]
MIVEVRLPEISENVDSGDVTKVLVAQGDTVAVDQPLIELETEKAVFEVPSTAAGVVSEINLKPGDSVKVGGVIAKIETEAKAGAESTPASPQKTEEKKTEEAPKQTQPAPEPTKAQSTPAPRETEPAPASATPPKTEEAPKQTQPAREPAPAQSSPAPRKSETVAARASAPPAEEPTADSIRNTVVAVAKDSGAPAAASPTVRRLARELGVDINQVRGTGAGGRISSEDVQSFAKSIITAATGDGGGRAGAAFAPAAARALPDFARYGDVERQPMSKVRALTAQNMTYAWTSVPHVTQHDEADITVLEAARKKHGPSVEAAGGKLTMTSILVKVCAAALKRFPDFNASIDMTRGEIVYKHYYNIGIAVDTERGLLVPVLRDVDRKNLVALSVEVTQLAEKARNKRIMPDDLEGGNFTISNLGGIGGTSFTPIVNAPDVAILGVSRAAHKPVYHNGTFEPRLMLPLSLSYDHRLIDGAAAARFLRWVCEALEDPILLALEG